MLMSDVMPALKKVDIYRGNLFQFHRISSVRRRELSDQALFKAAVTCAIEAFHLHATATRSLAGVRFCAVDCKSVLGANRFLIRPASVRLLKMSSSSASNQQLSTKVTSTPKMKVELHVHMDGAARLTTVLELSKSKGLPLPGDGSLEALQDAVICKSPSTLCNFLEGFKWIQPVFLDDLAAIERLAYETCETKAQDGVFYVEMRYSPHMLLSGNGTVSVKDVVASSLAGLRRAEKDFSITARLILCCMRSLPDRASEVVELCDQFRNDGVVGIDLAGDEAADVDVKTGVEKFHPLFIEAFKDALGRGIHRTVHAGEAGPANGVETAIEVLKAQRIGHGYHVLEDEAIYEKAKNAKVHFETCPYSSILTGAVPKDCPKHPIVRFNEDKVNFSISTDDPTITATALSDEYKLLYSWNLTASDVIQANANALRAAFLPEKEIAALELKFKENQHV